jgi:hypothetical protein
MTAPKYEFVEHKEGFHNDHWCIKILEGEYEGLVYQYDTVKFDESDDPEEAVITYNTITVANPNNVDLTQEDEKGILGSILTNIITEQMGQIDAHGTPDTE